MQNIDYQQITTGQQRKKKESFNSHFFFSLLDVITKKEEAHLQAFLKNNYEKEASLLITLLKEIRLHKLKKKHIPNWKKELFEKFSKKEKITPVQFNRLIHRLNTCIEQFLTFRHLQKNLLDRKKLLFNILQKRNAHQASLNASYQVRKLIEQKQERDIHYYQELFSFYHSLHLNPHLPAYEIADNLSEAALESIDRFYTLVKLRYCNELYSKNMVLNKVPNMPLLQEIQVMASSAWGQKNPLFYLYNQLVIFHQNPNLSKEFSHLVQHFENHLHLLSNWEQIFIFINLLNLANDRKRRNIADFELVLSDLYDLGFEHNLILQNNIFNDTLFINIIQNKAIIGAFEKGKDLIKQYRARLPKKIRKTAVSLSLAYLLFHQGKFTKVIRLLDKMDIKSNNFSYHCRIKILTICCYSEILKQSKFRNKVLLNTKNSFHRYLNRQKNKTNVNPNRITAYKNFLRLIGLLNNQLVLINVSKKSQKALLDKLNETTPIVAYSWFKKNIEELK